MKLPTSAEMRIIDATTVERYGIPGCVLMENAGRAVAEQAVSMLGEPQGKTVCVLCGKGNNGGDGLVAARWLRNFGSHVLLFLVAGRGELRADTARFLSVVDAMKLDVTELTDERAWDKVRISLSLADLVVDALLGTGIGGDLGGAMGRFVDMVNSSGKPVLAVDIPSGVDADTGQIRGSAVRADRTVTFALPKVGLTQYPGAAACGEIVVAPIGIPSELLTDAAIRQNWVTPDFVRSLLVPRNAAAHKGSFGHVLLIAGSSGMSGAAVLASQGALRAGTGLVTVGVPESLLLVMETKTTEAMTLSLPEALAGGLGRDTIRLVRDFATRVDVLCIGPGLGRQEQTLEAVREMVRTAEKPLVLDADALFAVAGHLGILGQSSALSVLTPHPGEMALLTGRSVTDIQKDRVGVARQAAIEWGCILVLKGAGTVVAFPDGEVFVNPTGNPSMATGGTGDVLAGMITAFIAQGLSSHDAAVVGVYIHGLSGDLAAVDKPVGMTASDLAEMIPVAIRKLQIREDGEKNGKR